MPGIKEEDLDIIFKHHPPKGEQLLLYETIRIAGKVFALTILKCTPQSADQTVAIRKVREAVMIANASIALEGKY